MELNLKAETRHEELIKAYLEEHSDEILATKIKDGVYIEKDGQRLLNRKTLKGCVEHVRAQAKKQAENQVAVIADEVVFGWAIEYFSDDSIEEKLFTEDGAEYKKKETPKKAAKTDEEDGDEEIDDSKENAPANKKDETKKMGNGQLNFFDMLG